jgi:hypothetical protein
MRRLALPGLAGTGIVVFLAVQLATGAALGSAREQLANGQRSLAAAEAAGDRAAAARADRRARAGAASADLHVLRARLDALEVALEAGAAPAVAGLLDELAGARTDLVGANASLSGRRSEVEALRSCFVSVTQALNLVSLDHRAEALDVLGEAAPRCREAEAAR